jgi:nucleoid-associated protein YgaU
MAWGRFPVDAEIERHERDERRAPADGSGRAWHVLCEPESSTLRLYRIEYGDTLKSIAKKFYGKESYWSTLYLVNLAVLGDSEELSTGQILYLPDLE